MADGFVAMLSACFVWGGGEMADAADLRGRRSVLGLAGAGKITHSASSAARSDGSMRGRSAKATLP